MKNRNAASTPKQLDVKPTALGILLDAKGAVGGLARAYTIKDDSGEEWFRVVVLKENTASFLLQYS